MWDYPEYVPVAQKKANAKNEIEKLKKKNPNISPVIIKNKKLATTWWGIAWNQNLEKYSEYESRIARGRNYVRSGYVLDLQINSGKITSLVQGSGPRPYKIEINIKPLLKQKWESISATCSNSVASMQELADGNFPKTLENIFTDKNNGLFPSPKEISFNCSCPDYALMCKHVAATLYGVGARVDEDPTLFFKLRDIDFNELLKKSIEVKMQNMLKNSSKKSKRVIDNADINNLFGV